MNLTVASRCAEQFLLKCGICSLVAETNALDGVTFYARGTNASGQTVLTNTAPDGGVRLETYYQDGSLLSVTGSAVHPVQYLYGVDADGEYKTEIKVTGHRNGRHE
jgi:hypothetical protein